MGGKSSGGGFLGIGGQSGFLNTGIFSSGAQKVKGFDISAQNKAYEQQVMDQQAAIANGTGPSIAQAQLQQANNQASQQALAVAASQRGASNPALAFRQAQIGNQQNGLENAQAGAIMAEQERRQAAQFIASQVNAQRGVAFGQAQTNQDAIIKNQQMQAQALAAIGGAAAQASGGKKG